MEFNLLKMEIACISFVNVYDDSDSDNDSVKELSCSLNYLSPSLYLSLACSHIVYRPPITSRHQFYIISFLSVI